MLHVIVGGIQEERLAARRKCAGDLAAEELGPEVGADELASMAGTMTLMGETKAFLLRGMLSPKKRGASAEAEEGAEEGSEDVSSSGGASGSASDRAAALLEIAEGLAQSPHSFIFEEESLLAKPLARLEKAGAKVQVFAKAVKKEPFNMFAMADALGRGDRKALWLLLMRASQLGIVPEQSAGILAWKARAMLGAARGPQERARLAGLSRALVCLYHDSHCGAGDLSLLLERFALELK